MRLEEHAEPRARVRLAHGGDRRRELGRVVARSRRRSSRRPPRETSKRRPVPVNRASAGCGLVARSTPASSSAASARARVAPVVARRAPRARPRTAGASRTTCGAPREPSGRTPPRARPSDANSVWWSRSTFVTTAISAGQAEDRAVRLVAFDDEPALPAPALLPSCGTGAPISQAGSRPVSRSTNAIIAAVVPLPCVPPTTIDRPQSRRARRGTRPASVPGDARVGRRDDHLPARPARPARARSRRSTPPSASRYGVATRSQPPTSAPHARASCAYADRPAPPMPTNQSRRPLKRRQARSAPRRSRRRRRAWPRAASPRPSAASRASVVEQRANVVGHVVEVELAHHDRAAGADEVARRSSPGGRRSRTDTGRGSPACPPPRAPRPSCRPAPARGRRRSTRRRCGRSTAISR